MKSRQLQVEHEQGVNHAPEGDQLPMVIRVLFTRKSLNRHGACPDALCHEVTFDPGLKDFCLRERVLQRACLERLVHFLEGLMHRCRRLCHEVGLHDRVTLNSWNWVDFVIPMLSNGDARREFLTTDKVV